MKLKIEIEKKEERSGGCTYVMNDCHIKGSFGDISDAFKAFFTTCPKIVPAVMLAILNIDENGVDDEDLL